MRGGVARGDVIGSVHRSLAFDGSTCRCCHPSPLSDHKRSIAFLSCQCLCYLCGRCENVQGYIVTRNAKVELNNYSATVLDLIHFLLFCRFSKLD